MPDTLREQSFPCPSCQSILEVPQDRDDPFQDWDDSRIKQHRHLRRRGRLAGNWNPVREGILFLHFCSITKLACIVVGCAMALASRSPEILLLLTGVGTVLVAFFAFGGGMIPCCFSPQELGARNYAVAATLSFAQMVFLGPFLFNLKVKFDLAVFLTFLLPVTVAATFLALYYRALAEYLGDSRLAKHFFYYLLSLFVLPGVLGSVTFLIWRMWNPATDAPTSPVDNNVLWFLVLAAIGIPWQGWHVSLMSRLKKLVLRRTTPVESSGRREQ